jgi:hypothetical protein
VYLFLVTRKVPAKLLTKRKKKMQCCWLEPDEDAAPVNVKERIKMWHIWIKRSIAKRWMFFNLCCHSWIMYMYPPTEVLCSTKQFSHHAFILFFNFQGSSHFQRKSNILWSSPYSRIETKWAQYALCICVRSIWCLAHMRNKYKSHLFWWKPYICLSYV